MFSMKRKWYPLGYSQAEFQALFDVKNTAVIRTMFGEFLIVKYDHEYHVFDNNCPHQNKPLNGCHTIDGKIVCPFHQYKFNLSSGRGHGMALKKHELRIKNGFFEVGLEKFSIF